MSQTIKSLWYRFFKKASSDFPLSTVACYFSNIYVAYSVIRPFLYPLNSLSLHIWQNIHFSNIFWKRYLIAYLMDCNFPSSLQHCIVKSWKIICKTFFYFAWSVWYLQCFSIRFKLFFRTSHHSTQENKNYDFLSHIYM